MADIYVRSTDGSDADSGATWTLAKATITGAAAIDAAGDTIFVSQAHAESTASAITFAFAGTAANPTRVIAASDAAEPPTTVSTASVTTTGNSGITITGAAYIRGIRFFNGTAGGTNGINLTSNSGLGQFFEDCEFRTVLTGSNVRIAVGAGGNVGASPHKWVNCGVRFGAASHGIAVSGSRFVWNGGSLLSGGTSPTSLFFKSTPNAGRCSYVDVSGVDLSNASASVNLVGTADAGSRFVFRNCKLPSGWNGALLLTSEHGNRVEMHNCDSGDTNYRLSIADYAGSINTETVLTRTGGASDGVTAYSWAMVSSANVNYPLTPLESPELPAIWNTTVGSSITATVEILHDSVTALKDDEIWIDVQYLGASGFPLSSFVNDSKADVLATAADQTTSAATWTTTGMTNPNKQKLSVSFTPQEAGYIQAKVYMAKPSYTTYVDPKISVA